MAPNVPAAPLTRALLVSAAMALAACGTGNRPAPVTHGVDSASEPTRPVLERVMIRGSAETPDPVLARVRALEADGLVQDVVVMESFPVQIELSAPRTVIDELAAIPRIDGAP